MTPSSTLPDTTGAFIAAMPKSELHIHLEGAIDPTTILELAWRHNRLDALPATDLAALQAWFTFTDFLHFGRRVYMVISDLLRTPEDFAYISCSAAAGYGRENIRCTLTPFTHIDYQHKGLTIEGVLEGLERLGAAARIWRRDALDIRHPAQSRSSGHDLPDPAEANVGVRPARRSHGVVGLGVASSRRRRPNPLHTLLPATSAAGLLAAPHAGETLAGQRVGRRGGAADAAIYIGDGVQAKTRRG